MIAGRYSLDREIGRGGMGAVWLGRDEVLGRSVALKRIGVAFGTNSPDLDRVVREARLAARLNHPRVVAVFDLLREGDEHWLVMEYVEGSTLAQLIRDAGHLTPDQAAPILAQAADALAAAHAAGIVHRDVKPSNILVTPDGEVKLSDFGIARTEADAALTQTGLVTGSPAYLAPEVATGRPATEASDMWALGATLYHALAGKPPYDIGDNLLGGLYRIVHEDPPRLAAAGWLAPLLEATMTRDPADRWSASEARDFLRAGPQAVSAGAPRRPRRTPAAAVAPPPADGTQQLAGPRSPAPPRSAGGRPTRRRSAGLLTAFVGVAVVAVLAVAAFAIGQGRPDDDNRSAETSLGPSDTSTPEGPTEDGMRAFVDDYLRTAADDPAAAYAMLTPAFQKASQELEGYESFWGGVEEVSDIVVTEADVSELTVAYTYTYRFAGMQAQTDDVRLRLVFEDGRYLIAEET